MKLNRLFAFLAIVIAVFIGFQTPTQAATLTQFDNKAAFLTATGAKSATGSLPDTGAISPGNSVTIGSITFSSPHVFFSGPTNGGPDDNDWTPILPGNDIAINESEDLNVDLKTPTYAIGFDFVEPTDKTCYYPCTDSTFTVTLKNGATVVNTFRFNAENDKAAFVGVSSDTPFDRIEIRDTTATIDDEYFGQFYTSATNSSSFNCGSDLTTYKVKSLKDGAFGGIRCVKFAEGSPDNSTPKFAWYGEGSWSGKTYRHVGHAIQQPTISTKRIGYASDIWGNGEYAGGNFDGNLAIEVVNPSTIRVTGAWNEEWQKVASLNYTPLAKPTTCGDHFDQYKVSDLTGSRQGSGLRCMLRIGPKTATWFGNGNWNGSQYSHLGTLAGPSRLGASDVCANAFGSICNTFAYGSLRSTAVTGGYDITGKWSEKWRK
jgi:hypothetical protein